MGYSFYTPCRSEEARDEMLAFLEDHYRPWSVLAASSGCLDEMASEEELNNLEWEHQDTIYGPSGDSLSYVSDEEYPWYIGFDFGSSGGGEGTWMKEFCRWVATKVGAMKTFKEGGASLFVCYDDEAWPMLERSEHAGSDLEPFVVTNGFRGWLPMVRQMETRSKHRLEERKKTENWSEAQHRERLKEHAQRWDVKVETAKRADSYVKKELSRLDMLWEERNT